MAVSSSIQHFQQFMKIIIIIDFTSLRMYSLTLCHMLHQTSNCDLPVRFRALNIPYVVRLSDPKTGNLNHLDLKKVVTLDMPFGLALFLDLKKERTINESWHHTNMVHGIMVERRRQFCTWKSTIEAKGQIQ